MRIKKAILSPIPQDIIDDFKMTHKQWMKKGHMRISKSVELTPKWWAVLYWNEKPCFNSSHHGACSGPAAIEKAIQCHLLWPEK